MPPDKALPHLRQGSGYPLLFPLQAGVAHQAPVASPVASSPCVPHARQLRLISLLSLTRYLTQLRGMCPSLLPVHLKNR
ncbi:MAG: hypothetical protein ACK4KT_04285 [Thermaurantimonas sp.]